MSSYFCLFKSRTLSLSLFSPLANPPVLPPCRTVGKMFMKQSKDKIIDMLNEKAVKDKDEVFMLLFYTALHYVYIHAFIAHNPFQYNMYRSRIWNLKGVIWKTR